MGYPFVKSLKSYAKKTQSIIESFRLASVADGRSC